MATSRGNLISLIAAVALFLIILFMLPSKVGGANVDLCSGRGFRNASDGLCSCVTGFHGEACEYKHCPFGKSWFSPPLENNVRNMPLVPCSNMGSCDPFYGLCECRPGFEGSACERLSCATTLTVVPDPILASNIALSGSGVLGQEDSDLSNTPQCSGHGLCKTMRELGREFNGYSLIRPPVDYNNWEADMLQSCLCDEGWQGYDCSQRSCPRGRDPTAPSSTANSLKAISEEVFVLQCQADAGFFSILALGRYSEPIPFDADPAYLKDVLERLSLSAGNVDVTMPAVSEDGGEPSVCGANHIVSTEIVFTEHKGSRPPMMLTRNTSNTRMWPSGSTPLSLSSNTNAAVLRFATKHEIYCPPCPDCSGKIYFKYLTSVSGPAWIRGSGPESYVRNLILNMEDLVAAQWTNLDVNVSVSGSSEHICNAGSATVTQIDLYSDFGNIPFLTLLDASYFTTGSTASANLTLSTNAAVDQVYECSNQGICDYSAGQCQCFQAVTAGQVQYRTMSSDGSGNKGLIPDCGFIDAPISTCADDPSGVCNNQGVCSNSTGKVCDCFEGFAGITCELRTCPLGRAWLDEPTSSNTAHDLVSCSNMGECDKTTGVCKCRTGYSGPACDIRDCDRDDNYVACGGIGSCVNTAGLFTLFGLSYGNVTTDYIRPGGDNWDAYRWHHCICPAAVGAGFFSDPLRPAVGPHALVSGRSAGALPLAGWGNWNCTLRNCPKGHTSDRRHGLYAAKEVQRVLCGLSQRADVSDSITLSYMGVDTLPIFVNYSSYQIRAAIEYHPYIGNVTVAFPNFAVDGISTACHSHVNESYGGFTVKFETEFGDLPLLQSSTTVNITVVEVQKGNSTNLECGGTTMGFCDRISGTCVCNAHRTSSDGTGQKPGKAGDCSYFIPYPIASQDAYTIFHSGEAEDF